MSEKEIKKIDESSEGKVSGGLKIDKKALKILADNVKKFPAVTYGGPEITRFPFLHNKPLAKPKKPEGGENPQTALTSSQPQTEEKK